MKVIGWMLIALLSSTSLGQEYESTYEVGGTVLTLKLSVQEITTYYGQEKLLSYSVYSKGKFIHPRHHDGGRLISHSATKECKIHVLDRKGKGFGWLLEAHAIDGNTHSYKFSLIIPAYDTFGTPIYLTRNFVAKNFPMIQFNEEGISIWYYEQSWGHGGTASSIYVPRKLVIEKTEYALLRIVNGNVLEGIELFGHELGDDYSPPGFCGLLVAGIQDLNVDLMKYALRTAYNKEDLQWYESYGLPTSRKKLKEMVEKISMVHDLYEQVRPFVNWEIE